MSTATKHAITGAFGYSGKYIAMRLLDGGHHVVTLTQSPDRPHPFGDRVAAMPLCFDDPDRLALQLQGVDVLYITYWVRFNHRNFTYAQAVKNTLTLFDAAKAAGLRRVVYVSITNPSEDSPYEYFRGKAKLEKALADSGLSYAILRPTVLFGREDILVNNIAWTLRKLPIFGVFGDGQYRVQPIHVDDLARLAVEQGQSTENVTINANGPQTFTYRQMVQTIRDLLQIKCRIISVPPRLAHTIGYMVGKVVGDVTITWDEIMALKHELLFTETKPTGTIKLTDYVRENADQLGQQYHSEIARRLDRVQAYV